MPKPPIPEGRLARVFQEAMKLWDTLRTNGATFNERAAGLELVLRKHWPFTREWKYLCAGCDDTGLVIEQCPGDASCGRQRLHGPHTFGQACWCSLGAKFRDPKPSPQDFAQAGKVKKKRDGFTRAGR